MNTKMRTRIFTLAVLIITLLMSSTIIGKAVEAKVINTDNSIQELSREINELKLNVNEYRSNMDSAHTMAQAARSLDIQESDNIIQKAKEIYSENHKSVYLANNRINELDTQLATLKASQVYVGEFKLTGYCACSICCGKWANGITASGAKAVEGITVAADPRVLPLGTKVYIEGIGERIVQDTGGAIKKNKIDVYVAYHKKAYNAEYNQKAAKVWILK